MRSLTNLLALSVLTLAVSVPATSQETSTRAMRAHWVEVLHKLEAHPGSAEIVSDAQGVVKEFINVHDFHMVICPVINELPKKYSHQQPITQLFTLGLAAYQVETGQSDNEGANLYALHSVLKGYSALLAIDPKAKDKKLDELAKLDVENRLPEFIAKHGCKNN